MIVTQIPEDLYREVKTRLAEKGQTMDSYIKSLVSEDLGVTPKSEFRTVCFRIPENEYKQLKLSAINRSMTIKGLVESLIMRDIDEKGIMERFETEDSRGKCKTISFQVSNNLFKAIKQRIPQTGMSDQDYMRTLIYNSETHQECEENMSEARSLILAIEISAWLYELLLIETAQTDSAVEEIAESAFRKFMERMDNNVD